MPVGHLSSVFWCGLNTSLLHRAPKTPLPVALCQGGRGGGWGENEEENENKGEEEAFNHQLNNWLHRDWGLKVLLASFFPIATTAPELFVLQRVPATALLVLCLPKSIQGTPLLFPKAAKQTCFGLWLERNVSKELLLFLEHTMDAASHQGDLHHHLTHLKIVKD